MQTFSHPRSLVPPFKVVRRVLPALSACLAGSDTFSLRTLAGAEQKKTLRCIDNLRFCKV